MAKWYIRDFSLLVGVSVQTLHHYDRINLLKPSIRLLNGYRLYSEKDLLRLQQIVALKFFGFELSVIKKLLAKGDTPLDHLKKQAQFLDEKAKRYSIASQTLKSVISDVERDESISWETLTQLIGVYRMTQQLEHPWVRDIFTPDELKQYAAFEAELKSESNASKLALFEKDWNQLVEEIESHLGEDPASPAGVQIGGQCMVLINHLYGRKYAHLRTKKWEQGFGEGKGLDDIGLTLESVAWLDKAVDAYWKQRIKSILAQVGKKPTSELADLWANVMDEMYGEDEGRKAKALQFAINHADVDVKAKEWLISLV